MKEREKKKKINKSHSEKNLGIAVFPFTMGCNFSVSSGMHWSSGASCPAFAALPFDIKTLN